MEDRQINFTRTEKFNWQSTIKINILKLRVVGLWPKDDDLYQLNSYALWTAITFLCFNFAHNFFQAVKIFLLNDLKMITSIIYLNMSEVLGLLKAYYLFRNMPMLKRLMITLRSDIFQPKNERQRKLIEPNLKFWKFNYILFWTMSAGAILFWISIPFLDNTWKEYRLPFMAWYPFNTDVSPNYELAYVHQSIGVIFIAISTVGVDTLITSLTMYTACQIDILCDNLRNLKATDFNKNLIRCIQHHLEILRFAADSNKFFNWIVFYQFFISAMSIGITLFQMKLVVPFSSEFYSLLSFELAIILEIFMYCWFGNEIQEKSKHIAYAAFESEWIDAPLAAQKSLIIFMSNCQKPMKTVSALGLFSLSLETFVTILRTAWSYFTLLNGMSSRS